MSGAHEQFGPYLVYEQLGIGGMASVHRATLAGVEGFSRVVALKRMLPHVAANDEMVKAFVREARLASFLRHENVAQTYELGRVDNIYFIAMELVTGRNLREILKHCAITNTGPMPVPVALHILNQICDALDYAHNLTDESGQPLGIIHRDVTPSNIIVSDNGSVKLIDFGIAKASAAGMQTMSGTLKGKFGYMAPEYIAGSIDARADLFAVGVIAHELLTNRPLFTGRDDLETLQRVQQMDIQPPSKRNKNVPREVDDIVMTALARNPDQRWQHATALRTVLGTITARMGLGATSAQVTGWIEYAHDVTKPGMPSVDRNHAARVEVDEEPSMSMSITDGTSEISADQKFAMLTPLTGGRPMPRQDPDTPVPAGTPSSMTAQRSIPPMNHPGQSGAMTNPAATMPSMPPMMDPRAPVDPQRTLMMEPQLRPTPQPVPAGDAGRHRGIGPEMGMMVDDVIPTTVRRSDPRIVNMPEIALPRTVTPPSVGARPQPQSSAPPMNVPMGNRAHPSSAPPPMGSGQIAIPRTQTPQTPSPTSVPTQMMPMRPATSSTPPPNFRATMPASPPPDASRISGPQIAMPRTQTPSQQPPLRNSGLQSVVHTGPNHPTMYAGSAPPQQQQQAMAVQAPVAPKKIGWLVPILMILVVAAVAGAVVYFVLPRLT